MLRRSLVVAAAVLSALGAYHWSLRSPASERSTERIDGKRATLLPAGSDAGYVDAVACSGCHRDIWAKYERTGMGHSLTRPRAHAMVEDFTRSNTFYHKASDSHFTMSENGGKYYQRRHQVGFDGKEINVVEKEIHIVVGSGNHARTYLHQTAAGRLFELPVAWYTENGGFWAMNPGYDHPNHFGFRREITSECLFCHTGYPDIESESDRIGQDARFPGRIPEGIDCQRCHGPGRDHIAAAKRGDSKALRSMIVNP